MSTDDIRRLSLKLLQTNLAKEGSVYLPHDRYKKFTSTLPDDLRQQANQFVEDVQAVIPNDFTFWFFFEARGVNFEVEFADGNTSSGAFHGSFTSKKSLLKKLRAIDWDKRRGELMQQGGILEDLVSEAADRPVNIPSSKDAAVRYARELVEVFETFKNAPKTVPFAMAFTREGEGIIDVEDFPSRAAVVYEMAEVMTTGYEILAVFENNQPWSFDAIEAAKLEAVQQLGPVSRAKAVGRFMVP